MKVKLIAVSLILGFVISSCGFWGVRGNGKVKQETRSIQEFQNLDAGGAFTIRVHVGSAPSLKISAEENLLYFIRTYVKGNTLHIDTKKNISPRKEILIDVTTPDLRSVDVSGANNISVSGVNTDNFSIDLSGAGHVYVDGTTDKFDVELSGAGSLDAKDLKANIVRVSVSGAASADVFAKESLDASVSGVGSIDYYGDPQKTRTNVSGVGSISRK